LQSEIPDQSLSGSEYPSGSDRTGIPSDAVRSLFVYNLFFPLVFLALLPSVLMRMFRRGGFRAKFGQRLGRFNAADRARFKNRSWIWIHSISVGETFVALKLAHSIHDLDPQIGIVLSMTTTTGFSEAAKFANEWLVPIYNPIDTRRIVRRTLKVIRPQQLILIEGEVWPNLVAECRRRSIPVSLVNARLSPRSEERFRRNASWTGPIFRLLARISVPEPEDIERWQALGADRERIVCTGSIKFDNPSASSSREAEFRELITYIGVRSDTPIIVAGSTWAPEEKILAQMLPMLRKLAANCFLILVPRHVERCAELHHELTALGLTVVRRSHISRTSPRADILLVDTTGELRDWYSLATAVFVGKSLPGVAEVGGQNPAEPAVLGKPTVFGPHMENFTALVAQLLRQPASAVQVPNPDVLLLVLQQLLTDPERCEELGARARAAVSSHAGATQRTADLLLGRS
jgi:3-deoxy-D-manno-octulosonic-acid transferase